MNRRNGGLQGVKDADRLTQFIGSAKQRGVTPALCAASRTRAGALALANQRSAPPHSSSVLPAMAECSTSIGAMDGTDMRHNGKPSFAATAKNSCVCSRSDCHRTRASPSFIFSPPIFSEADRTAACAPDRRTNSSPSAHALPDSGRGLPPQRLSSSTARASGNSKRSVASATGRGWVFSDTSRISPSVPNEPASARDTS